MTRSPLWHPFGPLDPAQPLPQVVGARGAYLELADGRKILDAISSWWVCLAGHCRPEIAQAIANQAATLDHTVFASFSHSGARELAALLVQAANHEAASDEMPRGTEPGGHRFERVFYSDDGSTAVEVALKLAYQHHLNLGKEGRTRFLALRGGYHGDTFGAMAVSDPSGFHSRFREILPEVDFIEPDRIEQLEEAFRVRGDQYAAMIVEPLIQGAGGMRIHSAEFLRAAAEACKNSGTPLICDEVFTGFYRTGSCFAFQQAGIQPDLVCVSKGITGGFLPLGATICRSNLVDAFRSSSIDDAFLHGHSYTANPIACAAALASWRVLKLPETQAAIARIQETTRRQVAELSGHPGIHDARSLGTIGAVTLKSDSSYGSEKSLKLRERALQRGVLLRPLGNVLYAVPPYCVTDSELKRIYSVIGELAEA